MNHILTIAFISTCLFSFGQQTSQMFWNNYSNFNPAMSGLEYEQHGSASVYNFSRWNNSSYLTAQANYNMRFGGKHGVGINYVSDFSVTMYNNIFANYNYQFNLGKAGTLATGVSVGIANIQGNPYYYSYSFPIANTGATSTIGFAYSWKNLLVGIASYNLIDGSDDESIIYNSDYTNLKIHAGYNFAIGKNFNLRPRALYTSYYGFHDLRLNVTTSFQEKYSLGVTLMNRDSYGVNIGWNFREKFQLGYALSTTISKLNNGIGTPRHELTFSYTLKPSKLIPSTPEF